MPESDWRCRDCGVDTDTIDEYYMVADPCGNKQPTTWTVTCASDALNGDSAALFVRPTSPTYPSTPPTSCGAARG